MKREQNYDEKTSRRYPVAHILRAGAMRSIGVAALAVFALCVIAVLAYAHDFWLVPDAFRVTAGESVHVRGQTSSKFPTSEAAVALDRVVDARLISPGGAERITDLSHSGTSLLLRHRPATPGQRIIAVRLYPRAVRESAAGFRRYLELEGAPDALARLYREGLLRGRDSVTRRYAKYAKTLVEVGEDGPRAFAATAEHPLEFVPLSDPMSLRRGDTVAFALVYRGRPLAGARVHGGVARGAEPRAAGTTGAGNPDDRLTTDAEGTFRLALSAGGLWNVRTIHVVQAEANSGADWETHWATFVFYVDTTAACSGGSRR